MVEPAPQPREQATEWRRPVAVIRRPASLEVVDTDLLRGMYVPARLREERRYVAARTGPLAVEDGLATLGGLGVEAALRRRGCRDGELVEVQGRQLRRDEVGRATH